MSTLRWEKKGQLDLYGKQSGKTVARGKKRRNKLEQGTTWRNIFWSRENIVFCENSGSTKKEDKQIFSHSCCVKQLQYVLKLIFNLAEIVQ